LASPRARRDSQDIHEEQDIVGTHPSALYSCGAALGVVDVQPGVAALRVRLYQLQDSGVRSRLPLDQSTQSASSCLQ